MQGIICSPHLHVCMRLITGVAFSFPRRRTLITWRPAARDYPSCCQSDRLAWDLFRGRTGEKWCWREIQFPWQRLKKMLNCYFHFSTGERKSCSCSTREKKEKWKELTFCHWAVPINCSSWSVGCGNWLKENVKIKLFLTRHRFLRLAQIFKHRCRCSIVFPLYVKDSDGEVQILLFW